MIGDRLIITDKSWQNSRTILNHIDKIDPINEQAQSIILIGGGSGTQKTETSDCLQHLLYKRGLTSLVISLDDFYIIKPSDRNEWRKENGIDCVGTEEIDWIELTRIIEDFKAHKTIKFQRFHQYAPVTEYDQIDSNKIDILIFEGLYANYLQKFDLDNLSVFLQGNPSQTYRFRLDRKKEDSTNEFRQQIVQKEFNVICQLQRYSNLIIPFE